MDDFLMQQYPAGLLSTLGINPEDLRRQQQQAGLLSAGLQLLAGSGYSPVRQTTGQLVGQAGIAGVQGMQQAGESAIERALRGMQVQRFVEAQKRDVAGREALRQFSERMGGVTPQGALAAPGGAAGPTVERAATIGQRQQMTAQDILALASNPDISEETRRNILTMAQLATPKDQTPASFKEFMLAQTNPGYATYLENQAKSKGVNLTVKTGESIAGQVGPILKESRIAALGAIQQQDAATRIIDAVDTGKIIAGPFADVRVRGLQIASILGIKGKDTNEILANTRQAIRGLAEMTLQGRKQMRGEGAITENEGKLAEKAMSGNIEDLTPDEIKIIAGASQRAAGFVVNQHSNMVSQLLKNPETAQLAPFYSVEAMPPKQAAQQPTPSNVTLKKAPPGVRQELWDVMTPEQKRLWLPQ